jgi:hypothetical protein
MIDRAPTDPRTILPSLLQHARLATGKPILTFSAQKEAAGPKRAKVGDRRLNETFSEGQAVLCAAEATPACPKDLLVDGCAAQSPRSHLGNLEFSGATTFYRIKGDPIVREQASPAKRGVLPAVDGRVDVERVQQPLESLYAEGNARLSARNNAREHSTWMRPDMWTIGPPADRFVSAFVLAHHDVVDHVVQANGARCQQAIMEDRYIGDPGECVLQCGADELLGLRVGPGRIRLTCLNGGAMHQICVRV